MSLFNTEKSAGSQLLLESKRSAALLVVQPDEAAWIHAIEIENILQKKSPATARRQARLIRRRLSTLDAAGWKLIAEREPSTTGGTTPILNERRPKSLKLVQKNGGCIVIRFPNESQPEQGYWFEVLSPP